MENKRAVGVRIFAIIFVLMGFFWVANFKYEVSKSTGIEEFNASFFLLLLSIPYFILGFGIFRLKQWARILGIILAVVQLPIALFVTYFTLGLYGALGALLVCLFYFSFLLASLIYLTRPKVKEQFKQ